MLHILKNRRDQARSTEDGFTLIELMVVVLIIAILLAIAIPTFLGAQNKAKDRSAQSSLRNGLTAAKTIYTDSSDYTTATAAALALVEPSLTFVATGVESTDPKQVSVDRRSERRSTPPRCRRPGTCFYIKDVVASRWRNHVPQGPGRIGVHRSLRRRPLDASSFTQWSSRVI